MVDVISFATASTTPGTNASLNGTSILGTGLVSTADDTFRNSMALDAKFYSDIGAGGTTAGTANAVTYTTPTTHTAYSNGMIVTIKPSAANTGAATLNLDAIGAKAIRLQGDIALVGGEMQASGVYQLRYDTSFNSAAGAWALLNPALTSSNNYSNAPFSNLSLTASVGSSALTIALKGADGNDPSATNPVYVSFRSATATSGANALLSVTAATSIVVSSGSTLGMTSAVAATLAIVAFNDAGTFRLGIINPTLLPLVDGIASSTAEGGAGAADSAGVYYTGTAVTSKAFTVLGFATATEATAGTWATAPATLQVAPSAVATNAIGPIGTVIDSTVLIGAAVSLTTVTTANVTSISLPPGDWDVWGNVAFTTGGTTTQTAIVAAISTTSATLPTIPNGGAYFQTNGPLTTGGSPCVPVGTTRLALSATTTVYLVVNMIFGTSTSAAYGYLGARRLR